MIIKETDAFILSNLSYILKINKSILRAKLLYKTQTDPKERTRTLRRTTAHIFTITKKIIRGIDKSHLFRCISDMK